MPQSRKRRTARRTHPHATGPRAPQPHRGRGDRRTRVVAAVVIVALVAAGAAYLFAPALRGGGGGRLDGDVTTPSGLKYTDVVVGEGPSPQPGQTAVVHYTGTLPNGTKFDSSVDRGQPYSFPLGRRRVIKGWDEGVATMKVGGKRRLIVPPALGYGPEGSPPKIPGNSTLVFDVELLEVR